MFRMFARRLSQIATSAGADSVMWGISLPAGSVVHDIKSDVTVLDQTGQRAFNRYYMYGVSGWVLPIFDPDAAATYDALLDALVPKDIDNQTIDLDTAAADTTPFFEPGTPNFANLIDVGVQPRQIYRREKLLSIHRDSVITHQDNQTPFAGKWHPGDKFSIRIRRAIRVSQPSVLLFAFASPSLDETSSTMPTSLAEAEWSRVKYMRETLKQAVMQLFGVIETGAETPWTDAVTLLRRHLMPDVHEAEAAVFDNAVFDCVSRTMIDHSVVGDVDLKAASLS